MHVRHSSRGSHARTSSTPKSCHLPVVANYHSIQEQENHRAATPTAYHNNTDNHHNQISKFPRRSHNFARESVEAEAEAAPAQQEQEQEHLLEPVLDLGYMNRH